MSVCWNQWEPLVTENLYLALGASDLEVRVVGYRDCDDMVMVRFVFNRERVETFIDARELPSPELLLAAADDAFNAVSIR